MKSGGLFVLGGLLSGVGKGLEQQNEERRQNALLALKRQYDVEDAATAAKTATALEGVKHTNQIDLLERGGTIDTAKIRETGAQARLTGAATAAETRKTEEIKFSNEKTIKALQHDYQLSEIQATALANYRKDAMLNHTTPDHYEKTPNGQIVIWNKDGSSRGILGTEGEFVPSGSGGDDGGSITGEKGRRGGTPAAPAAPAANGQSAEMGRALANLGNIYLEVSSNPAKAAEYRKQYPGMFDGSGNLLPKDQLIQRVKQRYGG